MTARIMRRLTEGNVRTGLDVRQNKRHLNDYDRPPSGHRTPQYANELRTLIG